jgi:hypothetical protein
MAERHRAGGFAAGKIRQQQSLERYHADPVYCLGCGAKVEIGQNQRPCEVRRKKFCNHQCAAVYNNGLRKKVHICCACMRPIHRRSKRRRKFCSECLAKIRFEKVGIVTKGQLFDRRVNYQSARSTIRRHAELVFFRSGIPKKCVECGYDVYVEVAHRVAVSRFSRDATLNEINAIDNLIALCPNHHWEFDHGMTQGWSNGGSRVS